MLAQVFAGRFDHPAIVTPTLSAGDMVVFSESIVHGDSGWRGPSVGPRLQLYFKFAPGWMAWRDPAQQAKYAAYATTDLERRLIAGPWTGRYDDDAGRMDIANSRRGPTLG